MATDPVSQIIIAAVAVGRALLRSGVVRRIITAVAIAALSRLIAPKPTAADRSSKLQKTRDPTPPRRAILGTAALAGNFHDAVAYGPDQMMYLEIIRIADHECDSLQAVFAGGVALTILSDGRVQEYIEGSTPRMWIWFQSGAWDQTAHSEVITAFNGAYTSADRGRGVCYAVIKCDMRSDKLFPSRAPPTLKFVVRGAKLYVPRLDTSLGGSHVWGTPSTYVWTDNLADIAYNLARGIWVYGGAAPERLLGGAYSADELPLADWAQAGADCAVPVALKAGGTEPRYRGGIVFDAGDEMESALEDLAAGKGGFFIDNGGELICFPGVARTPVATLTDKDFVVGKLGRTWRQRARERYNAVGGRFINPAARWEQGDLPMRLSPADQAADNGEERVQIWNLGVVQSGTQGQRVLELRRRQNRRQTMFTGELPPMWQHLEAGDWIIWDSARRGWTKTFILLPLSVQTGEADMLASQVTLIEVAAADFAWNPATDELDPVNPASVASGVVPPATLAGFAAVAAVNGDGGTELPAINVSWTVPDDPTIIHVEVQYKRESAVDWLTQSFPASSAQGQVVGVTGGNWTVRAIPRAVPARASTPTTAITVTLGNVQGALLQLIPATSAAFFQQVVLFDSTGTVKAGQLPRDIQVRRMLGGVDDTTGHTLTNPLRSGHTGSVVSAAVYRITAVTASGQAVLRSTKNGRQVDAVISVLRQDEIATGLTAVVDTLAVGASGTGTLTTGAATVTAAGGASPYTYAWTRLSGELVAVSPSSAASTFRGTVSAGQEKEGVFVCTVIDDDGATVTSAPVTAIITSTA